MKKQLLLTPILLAGAIAFARPAHAAPIALASYDFVGNSLASTDTDTKTTATNIGFSGYTSGATFSGSNPTYGNPSGSGSLFALTSVVPNDAIDTSKYLGFSISATAGNKYSLSSLTFDTLVTDSSAITGNYVVRSSLDGFTSNIGGVTTRTGVVGSPGASWTPTSIALTGFNNLTTSTQFHIYFFDNSNAATPNAVRIDNVQLNGISAVATPEPSTWAMMGLGLGVIALVARRRKRESGEVSFAGAIA